MIADIDSRGVNTYWSWINTWGTLFSSKQRQPIPLLRDSTMSGMLNDRRRALENSFFAARDNELLAALKSKAEAESQLQQLASASGIDDQQVLEELLAAGLQAETMTALALIPLVEVAWADESMDDREKEAILAAAADEGLDEQDPSYQLLEQWLSVGTPPSLLDSWEEYISALVASLSASASENLKQNTLSRSRRVAEAAGGFLGLGNKVSSQEQAILDRLEAAFC
jgi:hypothetical protein